MDHTIAKLYTKSTIYVGSAFFNNLNDDWQYMINISDQTQQAKITKDMSYQYMHLAEKMGYRYQNMSALLKRD